MVATDHGLAVEMIGNLVDNAIKHNRPGGSVRVALEAGDGQVAIAIEDDGPGIPPEERDAVFTRFTRLHRDPARGSGLGLSIARALAQAIGATIALDTPASGRGLRAVVIFPVAA